MSRRSGQVQRTFSRWFKERQIYHRSDGVVHFISMSAKTQLALFIVAVVAISWVAYATVNVVFKEQIIIAKEQEFRLMERNHGQVLQDSRRAYDEVNTQNVILQQNYQAALDELAGRHQLLRNAVTRESEVEKDLDNLSAKMAEAGDPFGDKPVNANRVMIDLTPGEPTPRQSRLEKLRRSANQEASATTLNLNRMAMTANEGAQRLEEAAVDLYTEQLLLLAELEETASRRAEELRFVLAATGLDANTFLINPKIANTAFAQGGPFIDPENLDRASPEFIHRVNRTISTLDEFEKLKQAVERIPLSSPSTSIRQMTSPFGFRRDPFHGRLTKHNGLDFHAGFGTPVLATGRGKVKFAGTRNGFGRTVEIDHGNGFMTRFAHMRRLSVKKGQIVKLHD